MLETLVVATRNAGKAEEFRRLLAPLGIEVTYLADYPGDAVPEVVEDGETFRENAAKKARAAAEALGLPALADDSGLCVDALDGRPGVYSARYAGEPASDEKNNAKLLAELKKRGAGAEGPDGVVVLSPASFVCVLALHIPENGETLFAEGACRGVILSEPRGSGGFGYDPLFYLPELRRTFAELSSEEKNRLSHRGNALRALQQTLRKKLAGGC